MKLVRMQAEDGTEIIERCGGCGWDNAMFMFEPATTESMAPMCGECTAAYIVEKEMEIREVACSGLEEAIRPQKGEREW